MKTRYDVIVIGGGHAGIEAAHAACKLGCETLLLAVNLDTIGAMPCNPAVGGPGKSHLVKEIDALGGVMGIAADATYLQMRMLNSSRGPAMESLRGLTLRQGMVKSFIVEDGRIAGVELAFGDRIKAAAVVLCAGTFLE